MNELKRFYFKIFLFVLPIVLGAYILDPIVSKTHSEIIELPDEYTVWNDIYSGKINCDIAIYGSSRAWVHFDSKILSNKLGVKVYNFGVDGHNFNLQYLRHIELIKHNKKPSYILLSLDIGTLLKTEDCYNYQQLFPYMLYNNDYIKYTKTYQVFNHYQFYFPLLRYAGERSILTKVLNNWIKKPDEKYLRQNGFYSMDKIFQAADLKNLNSNLNIDPELLTLFNQFITECNKNNIKLIFIYSPEYIEGHRFYLNREEIIDKYKSIAMKNKIPFMDYSTHSMCLDENNFYNYSHLNTSGSKLFTELLATDLLINHQW